MALVESRLFVRPHVTQWKTENGQAIRQSLRLGLEKPKTDGRDETKRRVVVRTRVLT